ncbi:surface antigen BspA-like [Trichomonas vaginalis G3]|uniref:Surface antigen BspA-like n=1 Tax=Trichomonas vaginalis (strain ATCC PRA-98 / G3) TaxID=412133 RepID=A2E6Q1_TRIV3|nr:ribonuclease inhibitor domain-containing protein [Trichomonas vaginalis G3]EAY11645.1 surface antigen BspA-like [Trichomonas vaginalis G3]KAI5494950.1 ribonuclease inhibitor domain-containing protein [Trichomonas vaginalis G3]|eukprot:XP_001323868.1 surface antigen BspA-like [Trichomonas vaginalis G3]
MNNFEVATFILGKLVFYGCTSLDIQKIGTNFNLISTDSQPFIRTGITTLTINTGVQYLFCNSPSLTTVVFSETSGLTFVPSHMFENCTSLQSVTFNSGMTTIKRFAFANTALTKLDLKNVFILEPLSFYKSGVQEITFNKNVEVKNIWDTEYKDESDVKGEYDDVYTIEQMNKGILSYLTQFMDVEFESDFRLIEKYSTHRFCVFLNESRLTKITLGSSVTEFKSSMFANCSLTTFDVTGNSNFVFESGILYSKSKIELICIATLAATEYTVPSSISIISPFAFTFVPTITKITVPSSVAKFNYAFANMNRLRNITFQGSVSFIPDGAFFCCHSLKNIEIPSSSTVTSAGDLSFAFCYSLVNLMTNSFEKIGRGCFICCQKLSSVDCSKLTILNEFTFYHCIGNTTFTFGDNIKIISKNAFFMSSIESFTVPANVISIEQQAFSMCKELTTVTLNSKLVRIGKEAFAGSGVKNIQIPNSVRFIEQSAFDNCKNVTFSFETGGHPLFDVDNNCFIHKATKNLLFTFGDTYHKFTVSEKVKEVLPNSLRFTTVQRERNEGGFTLFSGVNTLVIPEVVYDVQDNLTNNPLIDSVCLDGISTFNLFFPIRNDMTVFITDDFVYGTYYNTIHVIHDMCKDTVDSRYDPRRYDRLDGIYEGNCSTSINDTYTSEFSDPIYGGNFPFINQKQAKAVFEYAGVSPLTAFISIYVILITLALIFSALYIARIN